MTSSSSTTGGKRKVNKGLKCWVAFVKKVQKEEKLSYKDAIHRAKQRKDKGEKWMKGGDMGDTEVVEEVQMSSLGEPTETFSSSSSSSSPMMGGKRRTAKRSSKRRGGKSKRRGVTKRRSRGIARSRSAR